MATPEAGGERPWEYRGAWALAPMVRINTLPFRLLCAEHGADVLYSEELVDKSVAACRRSVSARGEAEYRHADGKLIFSTVPHERVAFQLGTASGPDALAAANVVVDDVCAVDVNMGCPVRFSTQGGMGSSLLTQPERVRDILTTLVRNLGGRRAVSCKIRLLETTAATLDLTRMIASCGVDALAVHCRRVPDRPRHWAQWDALTRIRQTLPPSLPLLLNGDVFSLDDARRALDETGADGLMLARGALWNASLFGREEGRLASQATLVQRYVSLAESVSNHVGNTKYVALQMLDSHGKSATFKALTAAKDYAALRAAAAAMEQEPLFQSPPRVPVTLEPPPDLPQLAALPAYAWRPLPPQCKAARALREAASPATASPRPDAEAASAAEALPAKRARIDTCVRGGDR
mmetsp:Transcript_46475/g.150946  ORF Transcript_46475/g.150946 Transcript_46475/m.150946 type:complete len:407 (-) Transcript_46475:113-1333(-)